MANDTRFKEDIWIHEWLETALQAEWRKFRDCPINPDLLPDHERAQAWGYVVAAYFLIEEAFKAILHLRELRVGHPPQRALADAQSSHGSRPLAVDSVRGVRQCHILRSTF